MKKSAMVLMAILLIGFSGCDNQQSSSGSYFQTSPETSSDMIGESGMAEKEILSLFEERINAGDTFYRYLNYISQNDIDKTVGQIYDTDDHNPNGFYWLPLKTYQTRESLYDYGYSVFSKEHIDEYLGWAFGELIWGVKDNGSEYIPIYITSFKEIDGRLYIRSDRNIPIEEGRVFIQVDVSTAGVVLEKSDRIVLHTVDSRDSVNEYVLLLQDGIWVLKNTGLLVNSMTNPEVLPDKYK